MAYLDGHDPRYEKMNPKRVNYFSTVVTRRVITRLSSSTRAIFDRNERWTMQRPLL